MELIVKKCMKCGAIIIAYKDCNCDDCGIKCCGEEMVVLKPNSEEASIEKHIPTYDVIDGEVVISVDHVMEEDHYIEFIAVVSDSKTYIESLKPGENAQIRINYKNINHANIYAYCNKHGLWKNEVNI